MAVPVRLEERPLNKRALRQARDAGFAEPVARVLAGRLANGADPNAVVAPSLEQLDDPVLLPDATQAAARIAKAVVGGEVICIETDHDADGVTAHAIIGQALEDSGHPSDRIVGVIGDRLSEGYGLSEPLAERILALEPQPSLVITADNGSSDGPRIARLAEAGIDCCVTDHHLMPAEGPPEAAVAVVSPARDDSRYPDPAIAGCFVAWLVMCLTRQKLADLKQLPDGAPKLGRLLDAAAVGTVADCVSLASSQNNRAVVRAGLALINDGARPCWRVARRMWAREGAPFRAQDLAFVLGPRFNAAGRVAQAMPGVRFLRAETEDEAESLADELDALNTERREIERSLTREAIEIAERGVAEGRVGLVVYLKEGHAGVHGIVASRLVERFNRPVVCLSPKAGDPDMLSGSLRGIDGFHVRDAMQAASTLDARLFEAFGGHAMAGGCTLRLAKLQAFERAFEAACRDQLETPPEDRVIWHDGPLPADALTLDTVSALDALDPYGREFAPAVFCEPFKVREVRPVGDGRHLKLVLAKRSGEYGAIWFGARDDDQAALPVESGQTVRVAFAPERNRFKGNESLQLRVVHAVADPS